MTASFESIAVRCSKCLSTFAQLVATRRKCKPTIDRLVPRPVPAKFLSHHSRPSQCNNNSIQPNNEQNLLSTTNVMTSCHYPKPFHRIRHRGRRDVCLVAERLYHEKKKGGRKEEEDDDRQVPKLLYMQNPISWLANKLDFTILRRSWDADFDEKEFKRGAKQAISRVTTLISEDNFDGMKRLMTRSSLGLLHREVETLWPDERRRNIGLQPDDIQLAIPRRIHFQRVFEQRFCDIDMVFIALKWAGSEQTAVIYVEVISRFHREYTVGKTPDWTISLFRITRYSVLPGY